MGSLRWVIDSARRWVAFAAAAWIVAALAGCAWIDTQQRAKVYKPQTGTMADWKPVSAHDEAFWIDLPREAGADPDDLEATSMHAGDTVHLPALVVHRITAVTDVVLAEVSTAAPGWEHDVVRLADAYGRDGTSTP